MLCKLLDGTMGLQCAMLTLDSPIFTYGGQATLKKGVDPNAHAIAYSNGFFPTLIQREGQREGPLVRDPIC